MSKRTGLLALAAILIPVLVVLASCGGSSSSRGTNTAVAVNPNAPEASPPGDIPDNQAYVVYRPPNAGYSIKVPEGWGRATAGGGVTFSDKLNSIRLEARGTATAASPAAVKRSELPQLAQSVPGFRLSSVTTVDRKGGRAIRISYLAAAKKDPVTGKGGVAAVERYLFFHNGREAVVTLSGAKGADNVDPWKIVTNSLRWVG
jgi:hypothetical protein